MSANDFLRGLPSLQRKTARALRRVILQEAPGVTESVVWDCLSYHRPQIGGRMKGAVCQIVVRDGEVRLDFIHGIRLYDQTGLLRGDLKSKRFVLITNARDARRPEVVELIRQAGQLPG